MKETWFDAVSRLNRWDGDVAVSWAEATDRNGKWKLLGATIRGGIRVGEIDYHYERLHVRSRMQPANSTAQNLLEGRIFRSMGDREFREIQPTEGQVLWLTSGTVYSMTAPLQMPSYYATVNIADMDLVNEASLSQPVFGSLPPYYPTGAEALLDVLFGVTRDQGQRDNFNQILIQLPYTDAYIEGASFIDGQGTVISVGEGRKGSATGHRLQAMWKIQASELTYQRSTLDVSQAGPVIFPVGAEPYYLSASLQDSSGLLIDTIEQRRREDTQAATYPLPAEALPEALDFLASVWRNVTGDHLFEVRRVSPSSELTAQVAAREDFSSRMSALGDVLKAIRIDDSLIDSKAAKGVAKDATLGRLKLVVQKRLAAPEVDTAIAAVEVLQDIIRVRVALQHQHADPDLPTALAKLGISYPGPWPDMWEAIRHRAVGALRDLRNALDSAST